LDPLNKTYYWSKLLNMLVVLPFFILAILFFNKKRVDKIINEYDNKKSVFSPINWIFFIALTIMPLATIIVLLRK